MAKDEVLIVGAGPVGLTMGILLAELKQKFKIIDKSKVPAMDSRAAGIQPRTLEVFELMGVLSKFLQDGVKVVGFNIFSKKRELLHASYKGFDTPYSFVLDLPQSQTEHILLKKLESLGHSVHRGVELSNLEIKKESVHVTLKEGEERTTPDEYLYVIGCDGARSACRKLTNTSFPGSEYPTKWIVLDAKLDWNYDFQEMNLFPHEDGLIAVFPLPHERSRIVIEYPSDLSSSPSFEMAQKALQNRISSDITFREPTDINPFIMHHRQVTSYKTERVFLAGDAAHLHSPAGGQGMNTGIQDAFNLAWKLAFVIQNKAPPTLLDSYHEERHPVAKEVLSITDRITKMMTVKNPALSFMRDSFMSTVGSFDTLKKQLPLKFSQTTICYKSSNIIKESAKHPPKELKLGARAPDHMLKKAGDEIRLFSLLSLSNFTLLLFSGKHPSEETFKCLNEIASDIHPLVSPFIIYRNQSDYDQSAMKETSFLDLEPSMHTHYGITNPTAVLIRPDGYIGMIQEPPSKEFIQNTLKKVLT